MRMYVIRHGESVTNADRRWTGWRDVSLTEKGFADARRVGEILRGVTFDKVYASDLKRAGQTALTALPDAVPEEMMLLREINVGTLAGRSINSLTAEERLLMHEQGFAAFDGETREQFNERLQRFLQQMECTDADTVAVFTHRGVVLALLDAVLGTAVPRNRILCGNCTVAVFDYNGEVWRLHSWITPET